MDRDDRPILAYAAPAKPVRSARWWISAIVVLAAIIVGGFVGTLVGTLIVMCTP